MSVEATFTIFRIGAGSVFTREAMKARKLIDGAAFGPDALKAIGQAFDEAWQEIAGNFRDDPQDIERARLQLANAVLSIAHEDSRNVEVLKDAALQRMALATVMVELSRRCRGRKFERDCVHIFLKVTRHSIGLPSAVSAMRSSFITFAPAGIPRCIATSLVAGTMLMRSVARPSERP